VDMWITVPLTNVSHNPMTIWVTAKNISPYPSDLSMARGGVFVTSLLCALGKFDGGGSEKIGDSVCELLCKGAGAGAADRGGVGVCRCSSRSLASRRGGASWISMSSAPI